LGEKRSKKIGKETEKEDVGKAPLLSCPVELKEYHQSIFGEY
jgi:hypothetical protein